MAWDIYPCDGLIPALGSWYPSWWELNQANARNLGRVTSLMKRAATAMGQARMDQPAERMFRPGVLP